MLRYGLVDAYAHYLRDPGQYKDSLLRAILSYPFEPGWEEELDDCARLRHEAARWPGEATFHTNTGQPYTFGPLVGWWVQHLEAHLEGVSRQAQLSVNINPFREKFDGGYAAVNPFWPGWDGRLVEYLAWTGRRTLLGSASTFLPLCRSEAILGLCERGSLDRIITTGESACFDRDAFGRRGVTVNDKMLNWRTGGNFWTCPHGQKHSLPLTGRYGGLSYNLLNLSDVPGVREDDSLQYGGLCKCGRLTVRFRPHCSQLPDVDYDWFLGVVAGLRGQYFNVQLVEWAGGDREVLYTCLDGDGGDLPDLPRRANLVAKIGRKRPTLWRAGTPPTPSPLTEDSFWSGAELTLLTVARPQPY